MFPATGLRVMQPNIWNEALQRKKDNACMEIFIKSMSNKNKEDHKFAEINNL